MTQRKPFAALKRGQGRGSATTTDLYSALLGSKPSTRHSLCHFQAKPLDGRELNVTIGTSRTASRKKRFVSGKEIYRAFLNGYDKWSCTIIRWTQTTSMTMVNNEYRKIVWKTSCIRTDEATSNMMEGWQVALGRGVEVFDGKLRKNCPGR